MVAKSTSLKDTLWACLFGLVVVGTVVAGYLILYGTWWLCYG